MVLRGSTAAVYPLLVDAAPDRRDVDSRLVDAALAVLTEHGLAGLTLARVADALGGSRMTLHRRGVTRDGLVQRVSLRAAAEYQQAIWPALTSSGTAEQRLDQALRATCQVADRYAKLLTGLYADDGGIFHDVEKAAEDERSAAVATRSVFVEPLARLLRDGERDGTLAAPDPDETATVLFNQVGWTYLALREGQRWEPARAAEAVVRSAMASVRPPLPRPPDHTGTTCGGDP